MFEWLIEQYQWLMANTKDNPIMGGAIFATLGGATFVLLKNYAIQFLQSVWDLFWRSITVTTTYTKGGGNGFDDDCYFLFMRWYANSPYFKYCKTFIPLMTWFDGQRQSTTGAGFGRHWFMLNGKVGWFYHSRQTDNQKVLDTISCTILFGNSEETSELIANTFDYENAQLRKDRVIIYNEPKGSEWRQLGAVRKRHFSSLVYPNGIEQQVLERIQRFRADEAWYLENGIPYKLCIVLEGPPGTGKTSLVRALASELDMGLSTLSLDDHVDSTLMGAVSSLPKDTLLFIEDFDSDPSTTKRSGLSSIAPRNDANHPVSEEPTAESISAKPIDAKFGSWSLSLSGLLNCLDGIMTPHGMIAIMTTNRINAIDPALIRPGRVDLIVHVGYLDNEAIHRYIALKFPQLDPDTYRNLVFQPLPGAQLQDYLLLNRTNPLGFLAAIPTKAKLESVRA